MKKAFLVLMTVSTLALSMVGCGGKTGTCDMCGNTDVKVKSIKVDDEEGWFCDDCYKTAKAIAKIAKAFS